MIAHVDPLKLDTYDRCTVAWSKSSASATTGHDFPYHMDSGAMSHCSPNCEDFTEFTPIKPHAIRGVNGTSISAIAVGKIKLHLGKGWRLTLHGMLFTPQATLRLISVGCLADEGITCVFECKGCTVRNTVGKILAEGA